MNRIIYYVSITLLTVVSSCGNKETNVSRKLTLDNCPVIAQVINLQGDPVTSLDFSSVKDTFNLSLSSLLSSFQVIRLENSEDALIAAAKIPRAAFFAPLIVTSPTSGFPPFIMYCSITHLYLYI